MSDLYMTGLTGAAVSISADDGVNTGAGTEAVTPVAEAASSSQHFLGKSDVLPHYRGVSVCGSHGIGAGAAHGTMPGTLRFKAQVAVGHANILYSGGSDQFSDYMITPAILGRSEAWAEVYRVENGVVRLLRTSAIIAGDWRAKRTDLKATQIITSASKSLNIGKFFRTGGTYGIGVSVVDATGKEGPIVWTSGVRSAGTTEGAAVGTVVTAAVTAGGALVASGITVAEATPATLLVTPGLPVGASGWRLYYTFHDPADLPENPWVELEAEAGAAMLPGDFAILSFRVTKPDPSIIGNRAFQASENWENVYGGWVLTTNVREAKGFAGFELEYVRVETLPEMPPGASPGEWALRMTVAPNQGPRWFTYQYNGGVTSGYTTLPMGAQYTHRFWLKASQPCTITYSSGVPGDTGDKVIMTAAGELAFEKTFTVKAIPAPSAVNYRTLKVTSGAAGLELIIFGDEIEQIGQMMHDFQEEVRPLVLPGMIYRDHTLIKSGLHCTTADSLTAPKGRSPHGITLGSLLSRTKAYDGIPWLQIEYYHSTAEWLDLAAFLFAPISSGHPMALRRASQGQIAPWIAEFPKLKVEFSNEMWNNTSGFWTPPWAWKDQVTGEVYSPGKAAGLVANMAAAAIMSSPFWTPEVAEKVIFVLGGWSVNIFGAEAAQMAPLIQAHTIGNYVGGWETSSVIATPEGASYANTLIVPALANLKHVKNRRDELKAVAAAQGKTWGTDMLFGIYEGGPGYQQNGLNGVVMNAQQVIDQEVVMKSITAGTAYLDSLMMEAAEGECHVGSFFYLGAGDRWRAVAPTEQGAGIYPPYQAVMILHDEFGEFAVQQITDVQVPTLTATPEGEPTGTCPAAGVYAIRSLTYPGRHGIVVCNRQINPSDLDPADPLYQAGVTNAVSPLIGTAWTGVAEARAYRIAGNMRWHNRYPPGNRLLIAAEQPGTGSAGTIYRPDPLSVALDFRTGEVVEISNPGRIAIGEIGPVNGGNALILVLDGVS